MIQLSSVLFGTDAEVFLRTSTGEPFPVCGIFGGTKERPVLLEKEIGPGFAVQEDNAAMEFNTPPSHSISHFQQNVMSALEYLHRRLPKGLIFDIENASLEFNKVYLDIPAMKRFGCEPDYNAFTMESNDPPRCDKPGFRSAAAHVHIGWENPTDEDRIELVKLCDAFASCSRIAEKEHESEKLRRILYGKAGSFWPKSYGIEHRVLSNLWIKNPFEIKKVLTSYVLAILALNNEIKVDESDNEAIMEAINTSDAEKASSIHQKYRAKLINLLGASGVSAALQSFR